MINDDWRSGLQIKVPSSVNGGKCCVSGLCVQMSGPGARYDYPTWTVDYPPIADWDRLGRL